MNQQNESTQVQALQNRIAELERTLDGFGLRPKPGFDPLAFQQAFGACYGRGVMLVLLVGAVAFGTVALLANGTLPGGVSEATIAGLPVCVTGNAPGPFPVKVAGLPVGIFALHGIGLVSVGGLAVGFLAVGGGAFGVVAIGGGAVGLVAFGGGAIGVLAFGGGAVGYVAVGGGGFGQYVLAGDGKGRHVFDRRRQDPEAVALFCRWLPRLRSAFADGRFGL
jgi:hypothetical protein